MKILLLTQDAPLYMGEFMDSFFQRVLAEKHEMAGALVFSPVFKTSILKEVKERFHFYGFKSFIDISLMILLNKILSKASGGKRKCFNLTQALKKHQVRRLPSWSIASNELLDYIREEKIDLLISVACPKILKPQLLKAAPYGCINYHTGKLPKYRGRQPLFWAMLAGEKEVGISIHEMSAGIDEGLIISQECIAVELKDHLHDMYLKCGQVGPRLLVEAIEKLEKGDSARLENENSLSTYNSFPQKEHSRLFRERGRSFFSWRKSLLG